MEKIAINTHLQHCNERTAVFHPKIWIVIVAVSVSFFFLYGRVWFLLVYQWSTNDVYSHGFIIPLISLYLAWARRKRLLSICSSPSRISGAIILLISLFMLFIGYAGSISTLQELSILFNITGIVLILLGLPFLKVLWFPVAYLLFMIPVWNIFTDPLQFTFQIFTAKLSSISLQFIGIPVYRDGVFISLPHITLEVAEICSGINYLIAVIAMGIALAALYIKGFTRKAILLCSAIIIAILSNTLRVTLIGVLSFYKIGNTLHGPGHVLQALFVSIAGYIVLFFGVWILSPHTTSSLKRSGIRDAWKQLSLSFNCDKKSLHTTILVILIFILSGSYMYIHKPTPVSLKMNLDYIPNRVGGWVATTTSHNLDIYKNFNFDNTLSRMYKTSSGDTLFLYVGYFESQNQGKELVSHKTRELHLDTSTIKIQISPNKTIDVNKTIRKSGNKSRLMLFWYDINGRNVTSEYMEKFYTTWDSFRRGRTNGAVIMIEVIADNPDEIEKGLANTEDFIKNLYPHIRNYLPGN